MADASPVKLEFLGGVVYAMDERPPGHEPYPEVIYAMAGAPPNHTRIPKNFDRAAVAPLDARGCQGFDSDQRLKLDESGEYAYPDSTYVCGPPSSTVSPSLTQPWSSRSFRGAPNYGIPARRCPFAAPSPR